MIPGQVYYIPRVVRQSGSDFKYKILKGIVFEMGTRNPTVALTNDTVVGRAWIDFNVKKAHEAKFSQTGPVNGLPVRLSEFKPDATSFEKPYLHPTFAIDIGSNRQHSDIYRALDKPPKQVYPHILNGLRGRDPVTNVRFSEVIDTIHRMNKRSLKTETERATLKRLEYLRCQILWVVLLERVSNIIDDKLTRRVREDETGVLFRYKDFIYGTLTTTTQNKERLYGGKYDPSKNVIRREEAPSSSAPVLEPARGPSRTMVDDIKIPVDSSMPSLRTRGGDAISKVRKLTERGPRWAQHTSLTDPDDELFTSNEPSSAAARASASASASASVPKSSMRRPVLERQAVSHAMEEPRPASLESEVRQSVSPARRVSPMPASVGSEARPASASELVPKSSPVSLERPAVSELSQVVPETGLGIDTGPDAVIPSEDDQLSPSVEPEAEVEAEVEPEPEAEVEAEVEPEPEPEPEAEPEPEPEPEVEAEVEPEVEPEPEPEVEEGLSPTGPRLAVSEVSHPEAEAEPEEGLGVPEEEAEPEPETSPVGPELGVPEDEDDGEFSQDGLFDSDDDESSAAAAAAPMRERFIPEPSFEESRLHTFAVTQLPKDIRAISALESPVQLRSQMTESRIEHEEDILDPKKKRRLELHEWYSYIRDLERAQPDEQTGTGRGDHVMYSGGYPTSDNLNFQGDLTRKSEIWAYRKETVATGILERLAKHDSTKHKFKLQEHQRFIPRFLSKDTPYNELLLFHGVGTGKTCTAVQVAEMYINETNGSRRPIIIAPVSVQAGFQKEIFSPTPTSGVLTEQCTGDTYLSKAGYTPGAGLSKTLRRIQSLIRMRYDFHGHRGFELFFERAVLKNAKRMHPDDKGAQGKMIIEAIERVFGDRLLIVDEAHKIRDPDNNKRIRHYIDLIARYASNTKILLMTATPMYNLDDEIITLINILRVNRGLPPVPRELIFDPDTGIIPGSGERLLQIVSNGFVSYLRGESPLDFPARIGPHESIMEGRPAKPTMTEKGEPIDPYPFDDHRDILPIVRVPLKPGTEIGDRYSSEMEFLGEDGRRLLGAGTSNKLVQHAVVTFPGGSVGTEGFENCFTKLTATTAKRRGMFKSTRTAIPGGTFFLSPDTIAGYAPKIDEMIRVAMKSSGIVFVFTENIYGSLLPIAMALEQHGITRYGEIPILDIEHSVPAKHGMKYVLLTGDPQLTKGLQDTLAIVNSEENKNGEKIKFVMATRAVSEGVNFRNIREVHLMDSYYHMSLIDQVVGRALRFRSHNMLPRKERNVTVYAWCVSWDPTHPSFGKETLDEEMYRLAESKSVRIGRVSRILKENAVDCHLMLPQNDRSGVAFEGTLDIEDAQRNTRTHTFQDVPGSRECDYKTDCAIQCAVRLSPDEFGIDNRTALVASGSGSDTEIEAMIRDVMIYKIVTTLQDLLYTVRDRIPGSRTATIRNSLSKMIRTNARVFISGGGIAYLEYRKYGSTEIISLRPAEISDRYATYIQRITRIPRKAVGYWGVPISSSTDAGSGSAASAAAASSRMATIAEESEPASIHAGSEASAVPESYDTVYDTFLEKLKQIWDRARNIDGVGDERPFDVIIKGLAFEHRTRFTAVRRQLLSKKAKDVPKKDPTMTHTESLNTLIPFARTHGVETGFVDSIPPRLGYIGRIFALLREHITGIDEMHWLATVAENTEYKLPIGDAYVPYMANPEYRREILLRIAKKVKQSTPYETIEQMLYDAYKRTKEIMYNAHAKYHIVNTLNMAGNVDKINVETGTTGGAQVETVVGKTLKNTVITKRKPISSKSKKSKDKNVAGQINLYIFNHIKPSSGKRHASKGVMCRGNAHPASFNTMAEHINDYFNAHTEISVSEEFKSRYVKEILTKNGGMVCIMLEVLSRALSTYNPPHRSG